MRKIHFPALPLHEKIAGGGGLTREVAIAAALANIQSISAEGQRCIEVAIQALETIIGSAAQDQLTPDQMQVVLEQAEQVINVARTFDYDPLERTSRSLCDIVDGMLGHGRFEVAPVSVHVRAMRLFAPDGVLPPAEANTQVVAELIRVATFNNYVSLEDQ